MCKKTTSALILIALFGISTSAISQHACGDTKNLRSAAAVPNLDHRALSDTFDIIDTHVDLDLTALPTNYISGHTNLEVKMQLASNRFLFELDNSYTIDSAKIDQQLVSFGNSGAGAFRFLDIPSSSWIPTSIAQIDIWYSGSGPADPTGWGGWHNNSPYFFNLGVGFGANPHSYGRSLFPAFDNFIEHSTYSFTITTSGGRKAYANGIRTSITPINGDTVQQTWECIEPVPAYLASVAVSNYVEISGTLNKLDGTSVPMLLLARRNDSSNVVASFQNLQQILTAFETWFGPYVWEKVGYAMTTQGAMEHATSIHLPISLANGSLQGEDIIAHELAHHWWGNLITCETAEDMWINEGMAEFSSHLYEEEVYNRERYMTTVRGNQLRVLNFAHSSNGDGSYIPLNGVDHSTTYGMHVYNKGAWIGHNLRGYLGDNVFKSSVSTLFMQNRNSNLNTQQLMQTLGSISGKNLNDFFSDWVTAAGQVAVSIDSLRISGNPGTLTVQVGISQHRMARTRYLADASLEIKLYGANGESLIEPVQVTSAHQVFVINDVSFHPIYATINEGEAYLAGTTFNHIEGQGFNIYNMDAAKGRLIVNTSTDSHDVYMAHHWAGPEQESSIANISNNRFWTVQGTWGTDFDATFRLFYDGQLQNGALDADLVSVTEDSLVVLHRPDASHDWQYYPHFTKNFMGSNSDGFGEITLTQLTQGDFVLANAADDIGLLEDRVENPLLKVYPNPTSGEIIVEQYSDEKTASTIEIIGTNGQVQHSQTWSLTQGWNELRLRMDYPQATYIVKTKVGEQTIVLTH